MTYTTQKQVRAAFWEECGTLPGVCHKRQAYGNLRTYNCDTRAAFADYIDMLASDGTISEALAARVTL